MGLLYLQTISSHNRLKAKIAKSFCSSYHWNIRNQERPWYGLWALTLKDLMQPFDNLLVVPQYPLWFAYDDAEPLADSDDDGIDELDMFREERDGDEEEVNGEANTSWVDEGLSTDSMTTVPDGNAPQLFPDFIILHFLAKHLPLGHPRFQHLAGLQITHECCPLVAENKSFPRRSLSGAKFHASLCAALAIAQEDLGYQCYYLFEKYPHMQTTIAIAASGDHWVSEAIHRHHIPTLAGDVFNTTSWDAFVLTWRPYVALGTPQSDARLLEISTALGEKPVLSLGT
jgi:hypothetical protein